MSPRSKIRHSPPNAGYPITTIGESNQHMYWGAEESMSQWLGHIVRLVVSAIVLMLISSLLPSLRKSVSSSIPIWCRMSKSDMFLLTAAIVVTSSVCVCITSEENHMAAVPSIPQNPSAEFTPLLETLTRSRGCHQAFRGFPELSPFGRH
jgi:hypothetical protein